MPWKSALLSLLALSCGRIGFDASAMDADAQDGQSNPCTEESIGAEPYAGGSGTADEPFQICSLAQLSQLTQRPGDVDARFTLMSDLDLAGESFAGIGSAAAPFTGVIEGNGHTIHNLSVTGVPGQAAGFINVAFGAQVYNLTLADPIVIGESSTSVGPLMGSCGQSLARNTAVSNAEVRGQSEVGGLMGTLNGCQILGATLSARVVATESGAGGIAGNAHKSAIVNVEATVEVNSPLADEVGGIVGLEGWSPLVIQNVNVVGSVEGDVDVGGLVGSNSDGALIYRSHFQGSIRGNIAVGGFVGGAYDSPFHVYSTSVDAEISGNAGVGGFSGYHYYRTRFFDSYYKGTITGTGANQSGFGGFFGDVEYYGWVERSYVDATINSEASTVGGFVGRIGYWSGSSDSYDIADSFSAANVSGSGPSDTVSLFLGENTDPNPLVAAGSYFWSGGSCVNNGAGNCGAGGMGVADVSLLQERSAAPLATWDFEGVWKEQVGAFPALRLDQLHAPTVTNSCDEVAIIGVGYRCDLTVTDADVNEGQYVFFGPDYSCTWLYSDPSSLFGNPSAAEPSSCNAQFMVSDGVHHTPLQEFAIEVHAGVVMSPTGGGSFHIGFVDLGQSAVKEFTLTNNESVAVTDFGLASPLVASPFSFDGGAYPGTGGTCGDTLEPNASCSVVIRFSPAVEGAAYERLAIGFTAARGPVSYTVGVNGTGRP